MAARRNRLCRIFLASGTCPYSEGCNFIHSQHAMTEHAPPVHQFPSHFSQAHNHGFRSGSLQSPDCESSAHTRHNRGMPLAPLPSSHLRSTDGSHALAQPPPLNDPLSNMPLSSQIPFGHVPNMPQGPESFRGTHTHFRDNGGQPGAAAGGVWPPTRNDRERQRHRDTWRGRECEANRRLRSHNNREQGQQEREQREHRHWSGSTPGASGSKDVLDHRNWVLVGEQRKDSSLVRVMSYNILADRLAFQFKRELYSHVPFHYLQWQKRASKILREIKALNCDFICLQEVDQYSDISQDLERKKYNGTFLGRTGHKADGCAIFWKRNKWSLVDEERIEFSKHSLRDNVALACVFQEVAKGSQYADADAGTKPLKKVVLGNIHVLFNPKRGDLKAAQVQKLLTTCHHLSQAHDNAPVVVCGDFNITPSSSLYDFISSSKLDLRGVDRRDASGQLETERGGNQTREPHHHGSGWNEYAAASPATMVGVRLQTAAAANQALTSSTRVADTSGTPVGVSSTRTGVAMKEPEDIRGTLVQKPATGTGGAMNEPEDNRGTPVQNPATGTGVASGAPESTGAPVATGSPESTGDLSASGARVDAQDAAVGCSASTAEIADVRGTNGSQDVIVLSDSEASESEEAECPMGTPMGTPRVEELAGVGDGVGSVVELEYRAMRRARIEVGDGENGFVSVVEHRQRTTAEEEDEVEVEGAFVREQTEEGIEDISVEEDIVMSGEDNIIPVRIREASERRVKYLREEWEGCGEVEEMRHPLTLRSAYAQAQVEDRQVCFRGEPLVTSAHSKFAGAVDYIWFTAPLDVHRVLDIPILPAEGSRLGVVNLPTDVWGSDHFSLVSEFNLPP